MAAQTPDPAARRTGQRHRRGPASWGLAAVVALTLVSSLLTAPAAAGAPTRPGVSGAELQRLLDRIVAAGAPGAIGFVRDGTTTLRRSSGVADTRTQDPLLPGDAYRIGSVTKTFVATLVLQLVSEGRLRLDAPVDRWLPGVLPDGEHITVRQLLNHTSGVFDYTHDRGFGDALVAGEKFSPRRLMRIANAHPVLFPPGQQFAYSNTDYIVLGLLVRAVTGAHLDDVLDRRIVRPLGLHRTSLPVYARDLPGRHAHGYVRLGSGDVIDATKLLSPTWAWAAGAVVSTADDVARFYRGLLAGRLLARPMLRELLTTVQVEPGAGYGLGILSVDTPCGTAWGHDGLYPGYYTLSLTSRDGRRQMVFMTNLDPLNGVPPRDLFQAVVEGAFAAYCPTASPAQLERFSRTRTLTSIGVPTNPNSSRSRRSTNRR